MVKTITYFGLNKQLDVHECVASGGIRMEVPVLCVRWDPKESLEASARLRSNIGLYAKRAWELPAPSCSAVGASGIHVRQSQGRG